ncbi:hypothetical protein L9F63_008356, partial [Diploptera punctata]
SHFAAFEGYFEELAARGHKLLVVSHFPREKIVPSYRDLDLRGSLPTKKTVNIMDFQKMKNAKSELQSAFTLSTWGNLVCEKTLEHPEVKNLIHSDEKFDLLITESFNTECFLAFGYKFQIPIISISTSPILQDFPGHKIARKHFGDSLPAFSELARNTSLIFVNTHFSLNAPRPLVPGVVEVAGIHVKPPKKLPEDLEDYLNGAEHGVIYFSMGSMIRAETLPIEKRDAFLQAFAELPQRVLWKWENETLPGQPKNVKISKWLPQFDILNHPNIRVFLAHGGLLGTIEAVHIGVPMIGIPMYGDQSTNVKMVEDGGMGIKLNYADITKENVLKALRTVLENPSYKENAMRISRAFRDRPMSPMDTAIYWTEYVIRHRGAPHMRTAGADLPLYQYLLLDVIAVLLLGTLIVLYSIYFIIKKTLSVICGSSKKQDSEIGYLVIGFLRIILLSSNSDGYKILCLFPHVARSHMMMGEALAKGLVARGHEVVVVSHFPQAQPFPNYTDISIAGSMMPAVEDTPLDNVGTGSVTLSIDMLSGMAVETCENTLSFPSVQKLMQSNENFDLIITEFFNTDCFLGFVHKFKAPFISIATSVMMPWGRSRFGYPDNPSYIPNHFLPHSDKMSFVERFVNFIYQESLQWVYHFYMNLPTQEIARKYFGESLPPLADIAKNTSLLLINTHFSINQPRPFPPNVIEVGGIHLTSPKQLPK